MATTRTDPLFDPEVVERPHPYYAHLRQVDPVHRIEGTNAFLVSRLDLIHQVVADPKTYSSQSAEFLWVTEANEPLLRSPGAVGAGPEVELSVLATADPPDHGRQRRVLSRLFSAGAINARGARVPAIDRLESRRVPPGRSRRMDGCDRGAAAHGDGGPPARPTGRHRLPALKEQGYASVELIGGFAPERDRRALQDKMTELGPVIDGYAAARSSNDPDRSTVIGACAEAVADGQLDDVEAFIILGILLAAGGESTTSLLGTGARILAEQPDLQDRLRVQPDLIPAFVEEACRVDPPFRGHYRRVRTDTTLGGVELEAGSRLVLLWPAANRDPETFGHPEDIDVHRPNPRQHVGFGWGIHLCLGAPLARLEAKVTFERLLARTSSFSIEVPPGDLRHHKSLMIRRLVELPLSLHQ